MNRTDIKDNTLSIPLTHDSWYKSIKHGWIFRKGQPYRVSVDYLIRYTMLGSAVHMIPAPVPVPVHGTDSGRESEEAEYILLDAGLRGVGTKGNVDMAAICQMCPRLFQAVLPHSEHSSSHHAIKELAPYCQHQR